MPACNDCKFYESYFSVDKSGTSEEAMEGLCRRNAPPAFNGKDGSHEIFAQWPLVYPDEWCGEFAPKAE